MTATRKGITSYEQNRRGRNGDYRMRGAWAVFEYVTDTGIDYRRAYWGDVGTPEDIMFDIAPATIDVSGEI